jgi:hypothetical protein
VGVGVENNYSLRFKIKSKLFWYTWKQHIDKYHSYDEFVQSKGCCINVRQEVKKDLSNYFNKLFKSK